MKFSIIFILLGSFLYGVTIDVVIPCIEKDRETLPYCINSIRKNVKDIRNIYLISPKPYQDDVIWIDERSFPFKKEDIRTLLENEVLIRNGRRDGWYLQQLLKIYAPIVIEGISENVLIVDSDIAFPNKMEFIDKNGTILFLVQEQPSPQKLYYPSFINHMERLHPKFSPMNRDLTAVLHHMLFQKSHIKEIITLVEDKHGSPFWEVFIRLIHQQDWVLGASEYELYFHYMHRNYPEKCLLQAACLIDLTEASQLENLDYWKEQGYNIICAHWLDRIAKEKAAKEEQKRSKYTK